MKHCADLSLHPFCPIFIIARVTCDVSFLKYLFNSKIIQLKECLFGI